MGQIQSTIMCNSVPLLYVYVRKNCFQCKRGDRGVSVCVCVVSASECCKVVRVVCSKIACKN